MAVYDLRNHADNFRLYYLKRDSRADAKIGFPYTEILVGADHSSAGIDFDLYIYHREVGFLWELD